MQVVLVPVILGAALNHNFPKAVKQTAPYAPLVAVIAVVLIVASVMAQNAAAVTLAGPRLIGAIIALHTGERVKTARQWVHHLLLLGPCCSAVVAQPLLLSPCCKALTAQHLLLSPVLVSSACCR